MEVSSLDLVVAYVREGLGVGLSITTPGATPEGVRALPLKDFPPVTLAAVWRKVQSPAAKLLVQKLTERAAALK